jgi:hypothetical protein
MSGISVSDLNEITSEGQAMRAAMVEAFANVTGITQSAVTISGVTALSRRSGVKVDFTVTGVAVDETAVNAAMTDTSSSGFGQVLVAAAANRGLTIPAPTVIVFTVPTSTAAPTAGGSGGSDAFPIWVMFLLGGFFAVIGALSAFVYYRWKHKETERLDNFKDTSKDKEVPANDIEMNSTYTSTVSTEPGIQQKSGIADPSDINTTINENPDVAAAGEDHEKNAQAYMEEERNLATWAAAQIQPATTYDKCQPDPAAAKEEALKHQVPEAEALENQI